MYVSMYVCVSLRLHQLQLEKTVNAYPRRIILIRHGEVSERVSEGGREGVGFEVMDLPVAGL